MLGLGACLAFAGACNADVDDRTSQDGALPVDGSSADAEVADAAVVDGPAVDAEVADAAEPADAAVDAAIGCHGSRFGAPAVPFRSVASIPLATGGTIPPGTYDAVDAQTTSTLSGTFRSTWVISGDEIDTYEQLTLQTTPPEPTPRTFLYTTSDLRLVRTVTCGGSTNFNNEYSVRTVGSEVFLDLKQNTILFTFQKR